MMLCRVVGFLLVPVAVSNIYNPGLERTRRTSNKIDIQHSSCKQDINNNMHTKIEENK